MPQIFKALVTVSAWALFIVSWLTGVWNFIGGGIVSGAAFSNEPMSMSYWAGMAISIGFAFAGGFLLIVRKKLE